MLMLLRISSRGEASSAGSQLQVEELEFKLSPPASQNHIPFLRFPGKGGSRLHHFVFSQGRRLAACQSPALGSQVLTKHRPEQEGGARGMCRGELALKPPPLHPHLQQ